MKEKLEGIDHYDTKALLSLVASFHERAEALTHVSPKDAPAFNDGLLRISRALNSAYYSRSGPYDQDVNELIPRFPGLALASELASLPPSSDEARFLQVRLKREENRVEESIREAIEIARDLEKNR
jgi:hypothetical protein